MRKVAYLLGVSFCVSLLIFGYLSRHPAVAAPGPDHEAAMAEVQRGVAICPTGNLDAAMDVFRGVEQQFPDEAEAVGWARYYHGDCLFAGLRKAEVAPLMKPVWDKVLAGEITGATAKFWFGHQYAKSLSTGNVMRSVAERTLQFAGEIEEPGVQIEEKIGFLNVFLSRCYYHTMEYVAAASAAFEAWQIGEDLGQTLPPDEARELGIKPMVLAAWSRLEQAKAERERGNILLAQALLAECAEQYFSAMEEFPFYRSEVETVQEECRLKLGLSDEVRAELIQKLHPANDQVHRGLWLQAAYHFACDALDRNSRDQAIGPMAVARTCYPDFPAWGLHIGLLWDRKIRGYLPDEEFLAQLDAVKDSGGPLEQAAIRIEMAEMLAEMGRPGEGVSLLDEAEALVDEPRLEMPLRVARAHCEQPLDAEAEVDIYEALLAEATGNKGRANYLLRKVGPRYWNRAESPTYLEWLDSQREMITDEVYRLQKAWWLRDRAKDYDAALELLEPLLTDQRVRERWQPRIARIVCLYRAGRDAEAEAALGEYEQEVHNLEAREHGLIVAACSLTARPEVAKSLAERVLSTASTQLWRQDAILMKGRMLIALGRYQEAIQVLESLLTDTMSEVVGEGMLTLARLCRTYLDDPDTARTYYQDIIASKYAFVPIQGGAYREYAQMEEALGNDTEALSICEQGLENLLSCEAPARSWLYLIRARVRLRGDDPDSARQELSDLNATSPVPLVRRWAGYYLMKEEMGQ